MGWSLQNMRLKSKLIVSFVLLIVISTSIIGWVFFLILKEAIVNEVGQSVQEVLKQTMQNIDYKLKDIDELYVNIVSNKDLQFIMETDASTDTTARANFEKTFYEIVYPKIFGGRSEQIQSVSIFGQYGLNLFVNTDATAANRIKSEIEQTLIYQQSYSAKGKPLWLFSNKDIFSNRDSGPKVIYNARKTLGLLDLKEWGLMLISVRESFIFDSFKNVLTDMLAITYLVDEKGFIISHVSKERVSTKADPHVWGVINGSSNGSSLILLQGTMYSVHYFTSQYTGWKLVTLIPQAAVYKHIELAKGTIIMIVLITVALSILFSVLISSSITLPLMKLIRHIKKVRDGDIHTKVHLGTQEEFGEISESFNEMTEEIGALISKVRDDEKKIREAELRALQAQINPHILYNTMDSIYWMTITKEYDEIAEMTTAFAQFFRLILNKGDEMTTIAKELETIEHYLHIQKLQFKDKFEYDIKAEPDVLEESCIKLILQPLVENALLHGIKPLKNKRGMISIIAKREGQLILLEVIDNGIGMDLEQIEALLEQPSQNGGYGIYNINERIHLAYGEGYGLHFESRRDGGSHIQIILPGGYVDV
ncbi:sensor histidine kinase [Paenibacillus agricola]|nr:sensor histidine kinase [Paenibacillus agricola]